MALGSVADTLAAGRLSAVQLAAVAFLEPSLAILYRLAERGAVRNVVTAGQLVAALSQDEARGRAAVLLGQPGGVLLQSAARWAPGATRDLERRAVYMMRPRTRGDLRVSPTVQSLLTAALTRGH